MFEQLIGVEPAAEPAAPAMPALPTPPAEPNGDFLTALHTDSAVFDEDRPEARDLGAEVMDEVLAKMFERIDMRKKYDTFFISDEDNPEAAFGLPPVDYSQGLIPDFPDEAQTEATFGRYADTSTPSLPNYTPGSPIATTADTFTPVQKAIEPPFSSLARGGYREEITDPSGELMRGALRRLVRSV